MPITSTPMAAKVMLLLSAMVSSTSDAHLSLVQVKAQSLKADAADLPKVEAVMAKSSETLAGVMEQANLLQSTLTQKQKQYYAQLADQKHEYENKLEAQRKENREIKESVNKVLDQIRQTRNSNSALRNSSAKMLKNVSELRVEFKRLETKLNTARSFATMSLNSTPDSSSELEVLNTPKPINRRQPEPDALSALGKSETVEQAMDFMVYGHHGRVPGEDDDADDAAEPMALLQLGSSLGATAMLTYPQSWRAALPRGEHDDSKDASKADRAAAQIQTSAVSLLSVLSNGLTEIEAEYRKAAENLQKAFQDKFNAGSKKRDMILAHKERATHRLESLMGINSKLKSANASLQKTQNQLGQRIKGLKIFLAQLSGDAAQ